MIYPRKCVICDSVVKTGNPGICEECERYLGYIEEPRCYLCGKEVESALEEYCDDCMKTRRDFDGGFPLLRYIPPVSDSVAAIKYLGRQEYVTFYADKMVQKFGDSFISMGIEGLVPIPIHKKRMKKRGFNQAALLAEEISKRTGIPLLDIMERTVDTLPQKNLSVDKRRDNLEKVFRIREGVLVPSVIMIVDDIFTTGATVSAAARILKESGASEVYFTSICRA